MNFLQDIGKYFLMIKIIFTLRELFFLIILIHLKFEITFSLDLK